MAFTDFKKSFLSEVLGYGIYYGLAYCLIVIIVSPPLALIKLAYMKLVKADHQVEETTARSTNSETHGLHNANASGVGNTLSKSQESGHKTNPAKAEMRLKKHEEKQDNNRRETKNPFILYFEESLENYRAFDKRVVGIREEMVGPTNVIVDELKGKVGESNVEETYQANMARLKFLNSQGPVAVQIWAEEQKRLKERYVSARSVSTWLLKYDQAVDIMESYFQEVERSFGTRIRLEGATLDAINSYKKFLDSRREHWRMEGSTRTWDNQEDLDTLRKYNEEIAKMGKEEEELNNRIERSYKDMKERISYITSQKENGHDQTAEK